VIESLIDIYDEERQIYESFKHEENINKILNQSDEAIQTERNGSHISWGMVLLPKKNLQDVAVKQLSALSKSINKTTLTFKNKTKNPSLWQRCKFSVLNF
jgi:hypothetical protein